MTKFRAVCLWWLFIAFQFITSCSPWGSLDNPLDPGAENYEGVTTVASSADLYPVYPESDGLLSGVYLSTNKVAGAVAYEVVIAATEAGLDSDPLYAKSDYTSPLQMSILAAPLNNTTEYFWKIRSIDASETWGEWSGIFSFTTDWSQPLSNLNISPYNGIYSTGQTVIISHSNAQARIYYTLDGSAPTRNSIPYTSPIDVSGDGTKVTIRAIACATGWADSGILSGDYLIDYSTWTARTSAGSRQWNQISTNADGLRLAATTIAGGYIYTSNNSGATWIQRNLSGSRNWYDIAESSDGLTIVAVYGGYSISHPIISTDGGSSWSPCNNAVNPYTLDWLRIALNADGTKMYIAATEFFISHSSDGGNTWTLLPSSGGRYWSGIASDRDGQNIAVVEKDGYIYTSPDSGNTWQKRTAAGSNTWTSICISSDGSKLAATDRGGFIYTSEDYGSTWTASTSAGSRNWNSITMDSSGSRLAAVASDDYIYTSLDFGLTWITRWSAGSQYWTAIAGNADGTKLVACAYGGYIWTGVIPP